MASSVARIDGIALLDIEGTTTPIAFVKNVLFPYARVRMAAFVIEHAHEPDVAAQIAAVAEAIGASRPDPTAAVHTLLQWSDENRKVQPLKTLQGMIWRAGYESGAIRGPVFADAVEQLRSWAARGVAAFIYSSGSVAAQKLLFRHSDHGDLLPLIAGHFDAACGGKLEAASYDRIAAAIGEPAAKLTFFSDHVGELIASRRAGLRAVRVARPGEVPPTADAWDGAAIAAFGGL